MANSSIYSDMRLLAEFIPGIVERDRIGAIRHFPVRYFPVRQIPVIREEVLTGMARTCVSTAQFVDRD